MRRRKDDVLIAQFAECADMILSGASLAACLERFPDHAAQLEPMLASVMGARKGRCVPARSSSVALQSRSVFMSEAARVQRSRAAAEGAVSSWLKVFTIFQTPAYGAPQTRPVALFAILLILFISGIVISGSVTLAASALPGDPLYGVKTATENVRLFLTPDEAARSQLRMEFGQRRIDEAQAVVERRRPVDNLRLQGTIESFDAQKWLVSGLRVTLNASSQVEGMPAVGAKVIEGRVRAPGDGSLVLIYAELQAPPPVSQVQELTVEPAPSQTRMADAATSTSEPTPTLSPFPSPTPTRSQLVLPGMTPGEPTDAPTARPTSTSTATATRRPTHTPTRTPTATRTRTPTASATATSTFEPSRPTPAPRRIIDTIRAINGNIWTIGSWQVEVVPATQISGNAVVGAKVECEAWERPGLPWLAIRITVLAPPEAPPERFEFQDVITAINSPWWTIGGYQVKVDGAQVTPGLQVGDRVTVVALKQHNGELWATSITLAPPYVYIEGLIDAVTPSSITIDGVIMGIDSATQFDGTPVVGLYAQAEALQLSDGSLMAHRVVVVLGPATDTPTPTPMPTASPTPQPSATPTLEPTAVPLESPTATTPPTATSEPSATPTP